MAAVLGETMSFEAFLDWEEKQEGRHYLHEGRVYAMAGASRNHGGITPALTAICRRQLREPCRYRDDATKVFVAKTGGTYYPDGSIACPLNYISDTQGTIDNPTAIFQVLSPSTARFDRETKFDAYRSLPSLKDYVLIASDAIRVEIFSRRDDGTWSHAAYLPGSIAHVRSIQIQLPLDELYEEAEMGEAPISPEAD